MLTISDHTLPRGALDIQVPHRRATAAADAAKPAASHRFGACEVRPACREVFVGGAVRKLQPRVFDLLVYLIEHRHRVLSTDELLDAVWRDCDVQVGSLATAIARIRSALGAGAAGDDTIIQTHHRVGYRFVAALECEASVAC
jgi:DNA-binding winged helix-turn-helix (wHTH) protein